MLHKTLGYELLQKRYEQTATRIETNQSKLIVDFSALLTLNFCKEIKTN